MKLKILTLSNLFILITILVVWFITASVIQPFLHYHFQETGFLTGTVFFKTFSAYPGGIADYLAEFIAQFFSFNTFGSFLIAAVAALQGFIALSIVNRLTGKIKLQYTIFALILLFGTMVLCDYRYPFYASIRLLFSFIFTWVFCFLIQKHPKLSIILWPVFASLLFYLANGAALFVFSVSTAFIYIITNKQRIWLAVIPVILLLAGLIPYAGYKFMFQMSLLNLYRITMVKTPELLAYTPSWQLYAYYSLLPALLAILAIIMLIPKKVPVTKIIKRKTISKVSIFRRTPVIVLLQVVGCALLGYFIFINSYDLFKKNLLTIEYYAENEQWHEVLKTAEKIEVYDFRVNYQVNRAYSHLGQLPDQLFTFPQILGSKGLFLEQTMMDRSSTMPASDLYFDLGFMSDSQHWAFEAQTLLPNSPRILKRLVMINLVNRKYVLADKFLNVLDQNMLYHDWVSKYEKFVSDTALAANDKVIAEKRRFNPHKATMDYGPYNALKLLLETSKDNRMAYDYLITYCILETHYTEFIQFLQDYSYYKLKKLPNSWEEALSIYILKTKTIPPFVEAQTISKECRQRFMQFNKTLEQFQNDLPAAKNTLLRDFGNTYWYYVLYLSPKVTNVINNKTQVR